MKKYKYQPKTKNELIDIIKKEIYEIQGTKDNPNWQADLNCIDTSKITDMSFLFSGKYKLYNFNGNISQWNVSNVTDMKKMFLNSSFNKNINNWDVSNVKDMSWMFANSKFNKPLNNWNVSNVTNMEGMFFNSKFNQDISNWDVSNVETMESMFENSLFNKNINNWNLKNLKNASYMFFKSNYLYEEELKEKIKNIEIKTNLF